MRVCALIAVLLLAKSQITLADNRQAFDIPRETSEAAGPENELVKNAPIGIEDYLKNNSPNNYPLEAPEVKNNITSENIVVSTSNNAFQEDNNNSVAITSDVVSIKNNDRQGIFDSNSKNSSNTFNADITFLSKLVPFNESFLPKEDSVLDHEKVFHASTKYFPNSDENQRYPENRLEIFEVTHYVPQNHEEESGKVYHTDNETPLVNEPFFDMASRISDEIKVYSNEAMMAWEDLKEKVEKASEASHVLEDYLDKIRISQSTNNTECVKNDLKNYEKRKNDLKGIVTVCEQTVKREAWKKLQKKTKKVLGQINDIKEHMNQAESKLLLDDKNDNDKETDILNEANDQLINLNFAKAKEDLSTIEKICLKEDEDELTSCIKDHTEKGMIVDTLNDIMRIKNNCVG